VRVKSGSMSVPVFKDQRTSVCSTRKHGNEDGEGGAGAGRVERARLGNVAHDLRFGE
jgi:hypothetical protein